MGKEAWIAGQRNGGLVEAGVTSFTLTTATVKRKLNPCRYVIMSGRGRYAEPVRFQWQDSFRHREDAERVAYWLRRDARV